MSDETCPVCKQEYDATCEVVDGQRGIIIRDDATYCMEEYYRTDTVRVKEYYIHL